MLNGHEEKSPAQLFFFFASGSFAMERCASGWPGSFNDRPVALFPPVTDTRTLRLSWRSLRLQRDFNFCPLSSANRAPRQPSLQLQSCLRRPPQLIRPRSPNLALLVLRSFLSFPLCLFAFILLFPPTSFSFCPH